MVTTIEPGVRPETVTLRETDLLEAGIVALESGLIPQCRQQLRIGNERCAEGVFADLLVAAYPERYAWSGAFLAEISDPHKNGSSSLSSLDFNRLHPRGSEIAVRAVRLMGFTEFDYDLTHANDYGRKTFAEIAAALRQAREEIEAEGNQ